jgi:DNA-binding NtrC family response regulator
MEKNLVVVDSEKKRCRDLCAFLEKHDYTAIPMFAWQDLSPLLGKKDCRVVILDIDTVPVDNRAIRELILEHSDTFLLCLSEHQFHPALKDAICHHIYACLKKPVDQDELFFWLRSVFENDSDSSTQPTA